MKIAILALAASLLVAASFVSASECPVAFKEVARFNVSVFPHVFIFTRATAREDLLLISRIYADKYRSGRFCVLFFNDEANTATRLPMTAAQVKAHFATYEDGKLMRGGAGGPEY